MEKLKTESKLKISIAINSSLTMVLNFILENKIVMDEAVTTLLTVFTLM